MGLGGVGLGWMELGRGVGGRVRVTMGINVAGWGGLL